MAISILYAWVYSFSEVIGINKEKEILLPSKEYISVHGGERINTVVKLIVLMHITAEVKPIGFLLYSLSNCEVILLMHYLIMKS